MFIELHLRSGEMAIINVNSIDVICPVQRSDCRTQVGLIGDAGDSYVLVQESYDEIKALLAGQVVAAQKETREGPENG